MLQEQLKRDSDPIGRIEAAQSLATKTANVKILGQCLKSETDWGVAHRIAQAF
jgi:hypothetical protein